MQFEITLPVLNEEEQLDSSVRTILEFLEHNGLSEWQLAIADNGSTDRTAAIAAALEREFPERLRYIRLEERGVGLAIRRAWSSSTADVVGYMDIDLATDIKHLLEVRELFESGAAEIVNGSRLLPRSRVVGRSFKREISSRIFNHIMKQRLSVGFTDAMCGFKFFRREIASKLLAEVPVIPDWFVSAELLVRGEWHKHKLIEIAVLWHDDPNSKAKVGKLAKQYLGHIGRLRREERRG